MKIFKKIAAFVLCGILLLSALIFLSDKKAVMAYTGNYIGYTDITGQNLKNATNTLDVEIIDRRRLEHLTATR